MSVLNAIQSAFTPAGTNAKRRQDARFGQAGRYAFDALDWSGDALNESLGQWSSMAGAQRNDSLRDIDRWSSLSGAQQSADMARRSILQRGENDAQRAQSEMQLQGMSPSAAVAAGLVARNAAARGAMQSDENYLSPDALMRRRLMSFQAANTMPAEIQALSALLSSVYGEPRVQVDNSGIMGMMGALGGIMPYIPGMAPVGAAISGFSQAAGGSQ